MLQNPYNILYLILITGVTIFLPIVTSIPVRITLTKLDAESKCLLTYYETVAKREIDAEHIAEELESMGKRDHEA